MRSSRPSECQDIVGRVQLVDCGVAAAGQAVQVVVLVGGEVRRAQILNRTRTIERVIGGGDVEGIISRAEVIRLSLADQECFAQALLWPPQPAPALERAFARRRKLLRAE